MSRVLDTNGTHVSTQTYGTLAYQPAELLRDGKLTKAVDVYSFGMIMWELYCGRRLFENNITGQVGTLALVSVKLSSMCIALVCE